MKKFMLATVAFSALALGSAQAAPLNGAFTVNVYRGDVGGVQSNANAAIGAFLFSQPNIANFTYTGPLNLAVAGGAANTFDDFFGGAGGISLYTSPTGLSQAAFLASLMSVGGFGSSSLLQFTGSYTGPLSGTVTHDDGASLYYGAGNTVAFSSPSPTVSVANAYTLPGSNTFRLVYVETNGAPSILNFDVNPPANVPEPMSMALLGVGLIGAGMVRRRSA